MWLVLCSLCLISSLWPLFDSTHLIPEFLNQARIQITVLMLPLALLAIWKKKYPASALLSAVLSFNVYWVVTAYPTLTPATAMASTHIRVFSQNIYIKNTDVSEVIEEVRASGADVAVLIEVNNETYAKMVERLSDAFPFYRHARTHTTKPGIALFSKYPLVENKDEVKALGKDLAMLNYQVVYGDQLIEIFGLHLDSPLNNERIASRNRQLDMVLQYVSAREAEHHPLIVVGDMNTAPWNSKFRQFQKYANLSNTDSYLSIKPSWPTWLPTMLGFPIDHVLLNNAFCDASKHRMGTAGSDHYGFISDLYICNDLPRQITTLEKAHPTSG